MEYQDFKSGIKNHLNNAAEDFFMVGYFLRQISDNTLFTEDGYKTIWDFAKGEYGLSASSTSRFMAINARFSIDGGEHMAQKYVGMGVSKLQEMLGLPDEELEKVTQETTVREIRTMKKKREEPKSYFGLPKTEKEKHPYTYLPGCGDGKYDCYSCARPCDIRQVERYCRTAPLGNPFPCVQMGRGKQLGIEGSLFSKDCQHLHPDLAPIREGDGEPSPCCQDCDHTACASRCDVAKKKDEAERQRIRQEQQKEAEARRPEPSEKDIRAFYKWEGLKAADSITADDLKRKYRNAGGGGEHGVKNFQGSARGIRLNYKREITWVQLAKRLKAIQEDEEKKMAGQIAAEPENPDIIDADFREVEDDGESEPENEADPEEYERLDVDLLLHKHRQDLKAFKEVGCPANVIKKQKILVDALEFLLERIDFEIEAEEQAGTA